MKNIAFLVLLLGFTQSAFAWSLNDSYPTSTERETQLQLEDMQQQLQQAKTDREAEKQAREDAAVEAAETARQEAEDRTREATEKAEQDAEDLRNQMLRSSIRTRNSIYLGVLLLAVGGFIYFITRNNKGRLMDENRKYGIVTMIVSFFVMLLALMISDGWIPQLDYLENLMNQLTIYFIATEKLSEIGVPYTDYLISIPTKYAVLAFLASGAYGFTTYLGITSAFKPWKKGSEE